MTEPDSDQFERRSRNPVRAPPGLLNPNWALAELAIDSSRKCSLSSRPRDFPSNLFILISSSSGVFLKAGGKPLHAECFKCATCSCSLKNIGHFHINNKFYCDNHAAAAKASNVIQQQQPAAPINVSQPQHQPKPQSQPQPQPQNQNWDNTLNANKAGAASNAEDFTKNFMADMFGSGAGAGSDQQQRGKATPALNSSLKLHEFRVTR